MSFKKTEKETQGSPSSSRIVKKFTKKFATQAIHAGKQKDPYRALNPPLYLTASFTFDSLKEVDDAFSLKSEDYVYSRGRNPTIGLFEERVAALECGAGGVAFASGMAAISTVLLSFLKQGDEIVAHRNVYGSTFAILSRVFPRFGIRTRFVDMTKLHTLEAEMNTSTKIIYFETPTNPTLEVIDIAAVAQIAHAHNLYVIVDNTFASPFFQQPLKLGADVVVHSATKYMSGHGDVLGGIAIAQDLDYLTRLRFEWMCELGGVISPYNAWLLLRGLKTLSLRMNQHAVHAQAIADFLEAHPMVERVIYPGLSAHPQHKLAQKQMSGFGGIVSFELKGDVERAQQFVHKLKLHALTVSLGDTESLVEIPALMTHRTYPADMLHTLGFSKKTIRISTGLENQTDIMADIKQALQ